ncbi:AlpA family transcriptional regulator [Pelomonas sp. KK5]|uniref:helix-turn-helix transcriptional regulator n=1 Tax=Pelomonas sp. KK5 TaxID=1855730 RepID=UPI00097C9E87|nr:helix-turn-helix domain-containing protein [Pelomonas sp. KK5]
MDLRLVTKADAAAVFGVCARTIDNYIKEGRLPAPVQFASRDYWHPDDFRAFLDRTFKRQQPVEQNQLDEGTDVEPDASTPRATRRPAKQPYGAHDSNPAVRQRARQRERVQALNNGT